MCVLGGGGGGGGRALLSFLFFFSISHSGKRPSMTEILLTVDKCTLEMNSTFLECSWNHEYFGHLQRVHVNFARDPKYS